MAKKVLGAFNVVLATKHGALLTPSKNTRRDAKDAKQRCCHAAYGRTTRPRYATKTRQRMKYLMIQDDVSHVVQAHVVQAHILQAHIVQAHIVKAHIVNLVADTCSDHTCN